MSQLSADPTAFRQRISLDRAVFLSFGSLDPEVQSGDMEEEDGRVQAASFGTNAGGGLLAKELGISVRTL